MKAAAIEIRPLQDGDTDAVVGLSLRAWAPVFESIEQAMGSGVFRRLHPDWREDQRRSVEDACASQKIHVLVAEVNSNVIGFVAVEPHRESSYAEIYMLAVDPDHHGNGVGTALTNFALDWIKDIGMPVAMVETGSDPGHAAACCTYEKAGFYQVPVARYWKEL